MLYSMCMYMGMCVYAYTHTHGLIDSLKIGKGEKAQRSVHIYIGNCGYKYNPKYS